MARGDNDDENIDYRSGVEVPIAEEASRYDEEDFSTLKHLVRIVQDARTKCASVNLIDVESKVPVDQQVLAFQFALNELVLPFEQSLMDAIGAVKRKQRGIK